MQIMYFLFAVTSCVTVPQTACVTENEGCRQAVTRVGTASTFKQGFENRSARKKKTDILSVA